MSATRRDLVLNWLFYFAMLGLLIALLGGVLALFTTAHIASTVGLSGVLLFALAFLLADVLDRL